MTNKKNKQFLSSKCFTFLIFHNYVPLEVCSFKWFLKINNKLVIIKTKFYFLNGYLRLSDL